MKELTILSGKGGTGKTSITAALASFAKDSVFCDNDVDAANLHLLFDPRTKEKLPFESGWVLEIEDNKCTNCGLCADYCRFNAIEKTQKGNHKINEYQCEGCRLCERVCPEKAIKSEVNTNNQVLISSSRFGTLVHAKMVPGEENSGKLVTHIRRKAKEIAQQENAKFIINDGPPGIGCTAISAITGADAALIVTEPSKSGLHDLERVMELTKKFKIPAFIIINKADINPEISEQIQSFAKREKAPCLAQIPFDKSMVKSVLEGQSIVEYEKNSDITRNIKQAWDTLVEQIQ